MWSCLVRVTYINCDSPIQFEVKAFICFRKKSSELGEQWTKGVPVEVIGMAYRPVINAIHAKLGGEAILRAAKAKAVSIC